ncbi:Polygalacturonase [bioreactor metagenome]|uniref:Polygalacturonase n=1 Tax=bioreactor metagenome TaxID=1076179 RepID=A0A645FEC9_9ZZZZ
MRGFSIVNSAAYTVWLIGCDTVRLENLTVRNHRRGPNTDGFDIDCSRDVTVIGCNLNCGDDCIAIKSDIAILGRDQPCERILVADCILSSPCCAVRLGYEGDGVIRDVIVVNTVIHDSNKGFDLISVLPEKRRFSICRGTQIENIVFQGAVMRNVRQALAVWSGTDNPSDAADYRGFIRRLIFSDLNIEATDSSFFGGAAVSELTLNNVNMRVRRDPASCRDATPVVMPNVWGHGFLPNLLTFHQVADPVLDHVRVTELTAESQEN